MVHQLNVAKLSLQDPLALSNWVELLQMRAQTQPHKISYTFLEDGETIGQEITYKELDQRAQTIATRLQSQFSPGTRALLLYSPGLEFIAAFFGCLYAGIVAVPAYPPKVNRNKLDPKLLRLEAIAADSQAAVALINAAALDEAQQAFAQIPSLSQLALVATDQLSPTPNAFQPVDIKGDSLAFLQYTSGSTGNPKGVMVSHKNLLCNSQDLDQGWDHTDKSVIVTWLPPFHDMGLIYGVLQPLYKGIPCYIMAPVSFLQKPIRWLQAISRYGGTHSGAPNFAYDLCVRKVSKKQRAELDLSTWKMALNGAEPVKAEVLSRFSETFADCGFNATAFCPGYGLAESTLKVAAVRAQAQPIVCHVDSRELQNNRIVEQPETADRVQTLVGCGNTEIDTQITIVNPDSLTRCGADEIGEIWVSGLTVAQGYWQRPDETESTFQAKLADSQQGPFLRTGDLGFLRHGELFITGRLKDLIVIRGQNHYPQDIEQSVSDCHAALKMDAGAAFSIEADGEERLIIVQEVERTHLRKLKVNEVIDAIRRVISQRHSLQVYAVALIKPASMPKTSSGKIQRRTCRVRFLEQSLQTVETWAAAELPLNKPQTGQSNIDQPDAQSISIANEGKEPPTMIASTLEKPSVSRAEISKQRTDQMLDWLRDYATHRINSLLIDERRCVPPYVMMDFGNRGIMGMQIPEQYGGVELQNRDFMRVMVQLSAIDLTLATTVSLNNTLGIRPIMGYGTQSIKDELLPLLARGREFSSFGMTEPGAGADIGAIGTAAIADGNGGWKIRGMKRWNASGWAGMINVFARLDDPDSGQTGLTGFIVRQGAPGLRLGPESLSMGLRGIIQNAMYFDDVPVSRDHLLGELGNGIEPANDALLYARLGIGMMGLGGMKRCAQLILRYTSRRSVSTGRLSDSPITINCLNEITGAAIALEALLDEITTALDQGYDVPREAGVVAKVIGAQHLWEAADSLVQFLGGRGYMENNLAPQIFRDARVLRIGEGPNESLNIFLGKIVTHTDNLNVFFTERLDAAGISHQLKTVAHDINERCLRSNAFVDRSSAMAWAYSLVGDLTCYGMVLGAVRKAAQAQPTEALNHAVAWAEMQFELKMAKALADAPEESLLTTAATVAARIADYTLSIDDIEQGLAGEDFEVDPLLQKNPDRPLIWQPKVSVAEAPENGTQTATTPAATATVASPAPKPGVNPKPAPDAEIVHAWIKDWVVQKLNVEAQSITPNRPFADFGLDSIFAVELAQDLEEWLDKALEPTLLWNYPTVGELVEYLTQEVQQSEAQPPEASPAIASESTAATTDLTSDQVANLSEENISALLAKEIGAV